MKVYLTRVVNGSEQPIELFSINKKIIQNTALFFLYGKIVPKDGLYCLLNSEFFQIAKDFDFFNLSREFYIYCDRIYNLRNISMFDFIDKEVTFVMPEKQQKVIVTKEFAKAVQICTRMKLQLEKITRALEDKEWVE